jgi:hypothetical protein
MSTFGDSRKRSTIRNACTRRRGGRAFAASDSRPPLHDIGLDGTTIPHASTPLRDARSHGEATPLVVCMATRPLHVPGSVYAGLESMEMLGIIDELR